MSCKIVLGLYEDSAEVEVVKPPYHIYTLIFLSDLRKIATECPRYLPKLQCALLYSALKENCKVVLVKLRDLGLGKEGGYELLDSCAAKEFSINILEKIDPNRPEGLSKSVVLSCGKRSVYEAQCLSC